MNDLTGFLPEVGPGGTGQIEVVDTAAHAPGCCIFTGDSGGPFLHLGRKVNFHEPQAYIHVPFVEEMARAVGMVSREELTALEDENENLRAENEALSKAFDALSTSKSNVVELKPEHEPVVA